MLIKINRELLTIVFLGFCFMIALTANFTITNMQKVLIKSIQHDNPNYVLDSNISLGLVHLSVAVFLWAAPSCIALTGPKYGLFISAVGLIFLVVSFIPEIVSFTYIGMIIGGMAAALAMVSESNYLVITSTPKNLSRNVCIIWVFYSSSMIFGNLYAASKIKNKTSINSTVRNNLLYELAGLSAFGALLMFFLPAIKLNETVIPINESDDKKKSQGALEAFKSTWKVFLKVDMLLLLTTFCYVGFQLSFGNGIYSSCLGFTQSFGKSAKELVPLAGFFYGIGDLIGGLSQMILSKFFGHLKFWSSFSLSLGFILQTISYIIIYINIPDASTFGETDQSALINSKAWLALTSSVLLGLGDSSYNTQIFPLLARLEPEYSAQTSAIYKFMKSISSAVYFFISSGISLHIQLVVLFCVGVVGMICFIIVNVRKKF